GSNPATGFEPADWHVGRIALAMLGMLVVLVIAVLALRLLFPAAGRDVDRSPAVVPPEPRLQLDPKADLARLRAAEQQALDGYYWIDRERGIVHIPIEAAMKQVVARGLDGFPPPAK